MYLHIKYISYQRALIIIDYTFLPIHSVSQIVMSTSVNNIPLGIFMFPTGPCIGPLFSMQGTKRFFTGSFYLAPKDEAN